jgi:DNA repair exonuclease SbcCD ATPase subunit
LAELNQQIDELQQQLANGQAAQTVSENERDNYLNELNDLDNDFCEQENILADKNAKLAEAIKEKNDLQAQLTNLWEQINNHVCPVPALHVCPPVNKVCSYADYEEIKQQRDNYQQQYQNACQEKAAQEQQITQQINQSLNLGLKEPSLEQVIERIKELINKPPNTFSGGSFYSVSPASNKVIEKQLQEANQTILNLEQQLKDKDTPFGEDLETIKEIDLKDLAEELNIQLSIETIQQIEQATSYSQLAAARNAEIKKYLKQNLNNLAVVNPPKEIVQQPTKERIIWLGLLLTALLIIGGLLVKLKANKPRNKARGT